MANHRARRAEQRLGQRFQFFGKQNAGSRHRGKLGDAMGGRFGTMCSAEGIHHEHVAQFGILLRGFVQVLFLAFVETHIFQQYQLTFGDIEAAVDPVLHQSHRLAQLGAQHISHRLE